MLTQPLCGLGTLLFLPPPVCVARIRSRDPFSLPPTRGRERLMRLAKLPFRSLPHSATSVETSIKACWRVRQQCERQQWKVANSALCLFCAVVLLPFSSAPVHKRSQCSSRAATTSHPVPRARQPNRCIVASNISKVPLVWSAWRLDGVTVLL